MVNGAPTDPSAGDYKKGAHQVLDKSGLKIAKEFDTPDWSPDKAQTEMEQSITSLGKDGFVGVYSANDGMAGGIIAAMKGAGIDPKSKPVTGGDSEVAAIQRILTGEQFSTIYLAIKQQAETSAELAVDAAHGKMDPDGLAKAKVDNGSKQVAVGAADADRGHEGQHPGHRHQGRLPDRGRDLHRQVQGGVQGGGHGVARVIWGDGPVAADRLHAQLGRPRVACRGAAGARWRRAPLGVGVPGPRRAPVRPDAEIRRRVESAAAAEAECCASSTSEWRRCDATVLTIAAPNGGGEAIPQLVAAFAGREPG